MEEDLSSHSPHRDMDIDIDMDMDMDMDTDTNKNMGIDIYKDRYICKKAECKPCKLC
jgi:hypothetical protein